MAEKQAALRAAYTSNCFLVLSLTYVALFALHTHAPAFAPGNRSVIKAGTTRALNTYMQNVTPCGGLRVV
jgi:hypothetical protein